MTAYLTIFAAFVIGVILVRFMLNAPPATIVRVIKFVLGLAMGVLGLLMSMRGLFFLGGPVGFYGFMLVARALGWEGMPGLRLPGLNLDTGARHGQSGGKASGVRTRYLDMTLDHNSGAMDGLILEGAFRGRKLNELSMEQVFELLREVRLDDPESERLLEAFLDRAHPDWRDTADGQTASPDRDDFSGGPMTHAQALEIMELTGTPSANEVREAYKQQMKKHHPDQGGSDIAAARLNQARDVLLNR